MAFARWAPLLASLVSLGTVVTAADNVTDLGKPLSIPASQFWDGFDGPWSTFRIEVGSPSQQIRVLPGHNQVSTLVFISEVCSASDQDCPDSHGELFLRDNSSTWDEFGQYELNTRLEDDLGLFGRGLYGWDTITLGWTGDGMPTIANQSIAGTNSHDYGVGALALNPRPINFTNYNNPIPSLMQNLRNMSTPIPSSSWSYTAGGYNLSPKIFGSLVLGGYDATRFEPNEVEFPFGSDISWDLQVAIQEITTNITDEPLLSTGIISYISTLIPDIWLPLSVCERFEEAFGLEWDEDVELYWLNDTVHDSLLERNPQVTMKVGPQVTGDSVSIIMPYWNFYLTATSDLTGNSTGLYFPLKRAANDTQYAIGRAFLQSAYLSADYERNRFNLSQARYPSSSTAQDIVAILPPLAQTTSDSGGGGGGGGGDTGTSDNQSESGLGTGAIAGIAVGGGIALLVLGAILFILHRRKKAAKKAKPHELDDTDFANNMRHEIADGELKHEVGDGLRHEVPGDTDPKVELYAGEGTQKPVEVGVGREIYEMPAEEIKYAEMDGEGLYDKSQIKPDAAPYHMGADMQETPTPTPEIQIQNHSPAQTPWTPHQNSPQQWHQNR